MMSPVGYEPDMPTALRNVRCWEKSRKHMLALSFSGFAERTSAGGVLEVLAPERYRVETSHHA